MEGRVDRGNDEETPKRLADIIGNDVRIILRHLQVLEKLLEGREKGIGRLAKETELEEHKVRYSLRILEAVGLIEATRRGARITPDADLLLEKEVAAIPELANQLETLSAGYNGTLEKIRARYK